LLWTDIRPRSVATDRYSPKIRCYGPIFALDPLLWTDIRPRSVATDRYSPKIRCYGPILFTQDPLLWTDIHPRSVAMDRYSPKIRCYGPIFAIDPQQWSYQKALAPFNRTNWPYQKTLALFNRTKWQYHISNWYSMICSRFHRISVANMVLSFGTVERCECFLVLSVGTVERCECFLVRSVGTVERCECFLVRSLLRIYGKCQTITIRTDPWRISVRSNWSWV